MSISKPLLRTGIAFLIVGAVAVPAGRAQSRSKLAAVTSLRCEFPLYAIGTWVNGAPQAEVKKLGKALSLQFESINIEDGTAAAGGVLVGAPGTTPIIVQQTGMFLNFVQILRDGPLYTTTVFDKETTGGKMRAVHTRHAWADVDLPGFTSKPEQYYGECELNPAR